MCLCASCAPPEAASNFVASLFTEPKDWEDGAMLGNLPPVNHDHVERVIKKHSLPHLISLVSWILIIRGTQQLRNYLGLADDWLHTSRQVQSNFAISNIPSSHEIFIPLFGQI